MAMSFTEKMQVWTLVLDYLKVVLGYPVTIPVLIWFLCWRFRDRIGVAVDALQELTFPGGGIKLRERVEIQQFQADIKEQTKVATERTAVLSPQHERVAEAIVSFFRVAARSLPLIPKAERTKFILESTETLPEEFKEYRAALLLLAEQAPEVHTLNARDVIITPRTGELHLSEILTTSKMPGSGYKP